VEEVRAKDDNITGELMIRKILDFAAYFCMSVDSVQRGGQVRLTEFGIYRVGTPPSPATRPPYIHMFLYF
jgi:hypothetical protein